LHYYEIFVVLLNNRKQMKIKAIKCPYYQLILILCFGLPAKAQKLPNIQQGSLRAPADIKIDGKATEWDNKFQAYNHATDIFYTLSNDDNNLYLTIQSPDRDIIKRILNGSITFTINPDGKKNTKNGISFTYPVFALKTFVSFDVQPKIIPGSQSSVASADSFMNLTNKRMTDRIRYIKVTGIRGVDTLISVYNNDGIKAAALFDNKLVYTWELAVSLKNIGMHVANQVKFAYNIKINEVMPPENEQPAVTTNSSGVKTMSLNGARSLSPPQYATDFWGEYTMIK
jgi:hypothetical protein